MTIKVALFDMAGTTVDDMIAKPGMEGKLPLVLGAYQDAFKVGGFEMPYDELNACRGKDKIQVFREKVIKYRTDLDPAKQYDLAQQLHDKEFVPALLANVQYLKEMDGTSDVFRYLREKDIFVATGSGFPLVVTDAINKQLGWKEKELVDFGTCGASAFGGRPKPNMINQVLVKAGYLPKTTELGRRVADFDYKILLKVGDTVEDVHEGNGVDATVIALASGTQTVEQLIEGGAGVVLSDIKEIPQYLEDKGLVI